MPLLMCSASSASQYIIPQDRTPVKQQDLYNQVAEGIAKELDLLPGKPTIIQELTINMRLR